MAVASAKAVVVLPRDSGYSETSDMDDEDEKQQHQKISLGVGSSRSASLTPFADSSAKLFSVQSLLDTCKPNFVPGTGKAYNERLPYEPVNARQTPLSEKARGKKPDTGNDASSPSTKTADANAGSPSSSSSLPTFPKLSADPSWPKAVHVGRGMNNVGNTCYLNSALQCLVHTPPLVRYLLSKDHNTRCSGSKDKFCATCSLFSCVTMSFSEGRNKPYSPHHVYQNIKAIAKHFRPGRQEDSHEFIRFLLDSMHNAELQGKGAKLPQKVKESTWVHQIFGGKLRSRVKCLDCNHPSDTFDSFLDLSLDIAHADTLKDAFSHFVRVDRLAGKNKYKCERCKRLVVAEKSFSIEEAPLVLTVHLKRFTAFGRKITDPIKYPETLRLGPYMSDTSRNPTYKLYGIVLHHGGGPHSGHYTAIVRAADGTWWDADDSSVSPVQSPLNKRNAYLLFYIREKGSALDDAVHGYATASGSSAKVNGHGPAAAGSHSKANGNGNGNGKRAREADERDDPSPPAKKNASASAARQTPPPPSSSDAKREPLKPSMHNLASPSPSTGTTTMTSSSNKKQATQKAAVAVVVNSAYPPKTFKSKLEGQETTTKMSSPKRDRPKNSVGPVRFPVQGNLKPRHRHGRRNVPGNLPSR